MSFCVRKTKNCINYQQNMNDMLPEIVSDDSASPTTGADKIVIPPVLKSNSFSVSNNSIMTEDES